MKTKNQFTNRILSLVLSIMMVVSMLPMSALTASAADGDACASTVDCTGAYVNGFCTVCDGYEPATLVTNENYESFNLKADYVGYYAISNAGQLFWFAQQVNEEGSKEIKGVLTADIELEKRPWTPIGAMGEENSFRGIFDGQNYIIWGLYVEGSENGVGFFGEVRTGTVKNFTIYGNVVVNTEVDYVGGVIGSICGVNGETDLERNGAIIQNITSIVNITVRAHGVGTIGGLVGHADHQSLIEQCVWSGTFNAGSYRVDSGAGGFIGKIQENTSEVTIRNCGAYGTIKTNYAKNSYNNYATIYMGGFLSFSNTGAKTTIENCLFAGKFERGENLTDEAQLAAFGTLRSVKAIKNCYYLGDDGLVAVHSDSHLNPGSDNVEITSVTEEDLRGGMVATQLGEYWSQGEDYPSPKDMGGHIHSHSYTYTDNGDGTHDQVCSVCDYVEVDNEAHSGGTATCAAQKVCTICGNGYGDLAPENHDFGSGNTCICGAEIAFTGIVVDDENSDEYRYDETSKTYTIIIPADEVGGTGYLSYDIIGTNLTLIEDTNTLLKVQHENEDGLTPAPDDLLVDVLQDNGCFGWSVLGYGDGEWEKLLYSNDGGMTWTTYTFEVKQAYSITVNASQNGTVTANEYAIEGDNIALNISPAEGYMLDTLSVTDASGNTIVVENNQFTMPASAVTVNATFAVCDHKDSRHETATDNDDGTHSFTCTVCGVTGTENHTLTYTANGNIITESCSAGCGYSETATIIARDATYDGLVHNTAIVNYSEGWKGGELTISYANNTNAGTATASITVGEATASVDFSIAKATVTVTADAKTKTYGEADPLLTYDVSGLANGDNLNDVLTGNLTREEGENAGTYAITQGTLTANSNYTIAFTGAEFTIIDKTVPTGTILIKENGWNKFWNTITFGIFCKDYVDVTITADGTGSGVAKVEYLLSGTALEENNIPADGWTTLNADNGSYRFSIQPQSKVAVYVRITDEGGNVTVINSDGIVVYEDSEAVDTEVTYTYKGNSNKDIAVEFNSNTVKSIVCGEKVLVANTDYSVDYESGKIVLKATYLDTLNAGDYTYTVSYNPMGVENSGVTDLTTTFIVKVEPTSIDGAAVNVSGTFTYDGHAKTPDPMVVLNGETLVKDRDYTVSYAENVNAGTATVTVIGKGNYSGTASGNFAIGRAELTDVSVQQSGKLTYNGQAQTPTVSTSVTTVDGSKVTFTYGTEMEGLYSAEIPSFTNVGWAHTVYYRATADNHNTYYGIFLVEIEKATVTEPTIASKTYNGSAQTADISDTDLYTVEKNNGGTEKGSYDVVLKLKDSANYKWSTTDNAEVTRQFKITQARNAWVTAPSIGGWTYGEAANAPKAEAKFGTVYVLYDGTANDGTTYDDDTPPTKAGSYVARFFVDEATNYEPIGDGVEFIIAKADQAAPTGLTKTDTTYFGKADGKISGLTSAMEFRKEGDSAYTAGFNGTLEYLAAGTYYVRYQGDANHNPSPDAVVTVNAGRKLQIVVPQNQVGYTVTVNKTEMEYEGSYTLKVEIHEGYTATEDFKIIISNWECGQQAGVEETYMNAIADQIIEVRGVADITPPVAEIKVKENSWTSFLNNLTFGLFFKETQDVTITVDDAGSGVKSIQYYLFDRELERDEVRSITDWIEYNGTFKINPDNKYVVYAKITDNDGNVKYLNSDGIVLDATVPVIEGIENGKTYYTTQRFTVKESNLESVTVNGNPSMTFALGGNVDKIYVVVATDKAGNTTTVTVTMKPIKELAKATENLSNDNVTSADITALHELIEKLNELIADPNTSDDGEKETLEQHKVIAESLLKSIEDAAKALDTENIEKVKGVTAENVTPEDKTDLEKAKADLEKALEDNGGNYTEDEKQAIEDNIKCIDGALEVIGNVEAVEDKIDKLPAVDTVKPDDEEAIKAITDAQTAYNTLSDYEKSLLDEATKTTLDKLAEVLMAYDIVEGDGSSWTEDSDHNITFVINGLFSKFVGIKVDGKDVDKANYEVKAGSTIITLKASYLDTLKVGEHTITVIYNDGSADGTFNVTEKTNAPTTGNHNNLWLWVALLFVSGAGVFEITLYDRKKRIASKK